MTLREMIVKKNKLADEARALIAENKVEEAETKKVEVENLNKSIELMVALDEESLKNNVEEKTVAPVTAKKASYDADVFINIFQNKIEPDKYPLTDVAKTFKNAFVENPNTVATQDAGPNGASIALPKDIQDQIIEVRKSFPSLENLVTIERVNYTSGSRIVELNSALAPFPSVDEGNIFPNAPKPAFKKIEYAVKKYGDILKFTYEMTQDAPQVLSYIKKWFAKRGVATRNSLILNKLNAAYTTPLAISTVDGLKDIINTKIPVAEALSISIVTNQDGFNFLDKMKNAVTGDYILQPDPTQSTKGKLLFGKHPILVLDNAVLPNRVGALDAKFAPVFIGDLEETVRVFDREVGTIDFNDKGAGFWDYDMIGMKGRERLDVQVVDATATVKGEFAL